MDELHADGRSQRWALVVDAEATTSQLCRDVLERCGFAVDVVDSGIAAVVTARRMLPDLILVDEQLRDVPGREAVLWLRSNPELRSTPIIVLTMGAGDARDITSATPGALLQKPASVGSIQQVIREIMNRFPAVAEGNQEMRELIARDDVQLRRIDGSTSVRERIAKQTGDRK